MKKDIKNIIALVPAEGAQQRCEALAAKMEADASLVQNSQTRLGDVKIEKWWSMIAGMMLIAAFILYTCYLTIPAVIMLALLAAFMIFVFARLHMQRKKVEQAEPEISPNRCLETLIRKALGLDIPGRDVSRFMDASDVAQLGRALIPALAAYGISGKNIAVKAEAQVTETEQLSEKCGKMPVTVTLTAGENQAALKWAATFALSATGDCMVDTKLSI